MSAMQPEHLSQNGKALFNLIEFDSDERLVAEIHKHPAGLFVIYATGLIVAMILLIATVVASTYLQSDPFNSGFDLAALQPFIIMLGVVLVLISLASTFVSAYLYKSNVVLVTSDKIAQIVYPSLFNRKISQLSIGDVQDVTVDQRGLLARMFNFGTLVVETAGEQQNYTFANVPRPYEASKAIVGSHEENLKLYGN